MSASALRDSQMLMARYLRDPQGQPPPEGVEERRLKIYRTWYTTISKVLSAVGFRCCAVFTRTKTGIVWCVSLSISIVAIRRIFWK